MRSKFFFAKTCFGMWIFIALVVGCKNKTESNISSSKGDFNGLYTVDYENSDIEYVWIFADDMHYVLYLGSTSNYLNANKSINYESPTHYYVIGKKFYSCGIDNNMNATPLIECKNRKSEPRYNIVSIDTIGDTYFKEKYQVIQLEDYYSKDPIKLKKRL
ncbi:hypothetical protein [Aequorivita lipolytica]|uniref:Lipoprotein n=1 Tax=Aequorivita lipolytica TaxID=153267 RepID=A0A5C6YKK7_9FLAO|nr:hypothetical protein [Aequorivita lipolytica]TXD67905.1 hypothetical protein ESV24_14520 [Aequorivita lipolytica]SRX53776.1 hypothetical protein AEQU2_02969 [Aequorivita lipolytica]